MSLATYFIVMLGGAFGSLGRFVVSQLTSPISERLPWGTVIINVTGSFVIGFFGTLTQAQGRFPVSENMRPFVMVGLCGGYTTFSAFSLQTLDFLRSGAIFRAIVKVVASVGLCVASVAVGHLLAAGLNAGSAGLPNPMASKSPTIESITFAVRCVRQARCKRMRNLSTGPRAAATARSAAGDREDATCRQNG
jgi:fluoride exporter